MAKGICWQIKFKSLAGVDCTVNIYKEGYTGEPSQLAGGAIPVYWEEDDSYDLLKVVRTKTGYISFIEETFGQWDDVFPLTSTDRYVAVWYGTETVFAGYLQPQSFENNWTAPPREIQIPIVSPLGVAKSVLFNPATLGSGKMFTGQFLYQALNLLDYGYLYVYWPDTTGTDDDGETIPQINFRETIRTSFICPFNDKYDRAEHNTSPYDIYSPCTVYEFIEGLCNAYGWVVHDTPTALIFTKHDHTGNYLMQQVDSLHYYYRTPGSVRNQTVNLDSYIDISSAEGTISTIMPVSRINISYNAQEIKSGDMDFGRCAIYTSWKNYNRSFFYFLTPMSSEFSGNLLMTKDDIGVISTQTSKIMKNDGCYITCVAQNNSEYGSEWETVGKGIMIQWSQAWTHGTSLFKVRLPTPALNTKVKAPAHGGRIITLLTSYKIELELCWAPSISSDYVDENFRTDGKEDFTILLAIRNQEGQYLNTYGKWVNYADYRTIIIDGSNGKTKYPYTFGIESPAQDGSLFFEFLIDEPGIISNREYLFFKRIGFTLDGDTLFPELFERPVDRHYDVNNGSNQTGEVSQFLTPYRYSENMIGDDIVGSKFTTYPYMFESQKRLQIDSRHELMGNPYLPPLTYAGRSDWKLLAIGFSPRDDEYKLTLQTF